MISWQMQEGTGSVRFGSLETGSVRIRHSLARPGFPQLCLTSRMLLQIALARFNMLFGMGFARASHQQCSFAPPSLNTHDFGYVANITRIILRGIHKPSLVKPSLRNF